MRLSQFIERVIEDASAAAWKSYADDEPKRCGAIAGLTACHGLDQFALTALLHNAKVAQEQARSTNSSRYWEVAAFRAEIEWVCECVSVVLKNQGQAPIIVPTARAFLKASEVLNGVNLNQLNG